MNQESINKLSKFEFIVLAPNDWNGQWMNRQQFFSRIGQHCRVIYSQGVPAIWDVEFNTSLLNAPFGKKVETDNILISTPSSLLFKWPKFRFTSKTSVAIHQRSIVKELDKNKIRVLYVFHPSFIEYVEQFQYDILVYHPYDDFSKQGTNIEEMLVNEKRLVDLADIVITPSDDVSNTIAKKHNIDDVKTVNNGVDFNAFSSGFKSTCPEDLANIKGIRIGYIGSINVKVDINVLLRIADSSPDHKVVLIGPVGNLGDKKALFNQLTNRPNVHLLGPKDHKLLPAYTSYMDCHLMCYDTSPDLWARYAYPLKLNEYLATKKPVLSCPLPSVENQESLMYVCDKPEEWVEALSNAIAEPERYQQVGYDYASQQDWWSRVEQIAELLSSHADQ